MNCVIKYFYSILMGTIPSDIAKTVEELLSKGSNLSENFGYITKRFIK